MRQLILNDGSAALVDDIDYYYLSQWIWHLHSVFGVDYVARSVRENKRCKLLFIHKEVAERMRLNITLIIDHKDRNPLNNCRDNLREATKSQNMANSKRALNNTSGYNGVHFSKCKYKWVAQIGFNNTRKHLGYFNTPEEAAKAYDKAAKQYFGEFAFFNFPGEV